MQSRAPANRTNAKRQTQTDRWVTLMSDKVSNDQPMEREFFDRGDPTRRCTAHRKNGERCRKWAIMGGTVCATHGGAAKHVRNAARVRLANAADRMAIQLLKMATDDNVSDGVKLNAIRDALDRAGLGIKAEIEVTAKPYESIFEQMSGGSRAAHRGEPADDDQSPALVASHHEAIDVEVVDDLGGEHPPNLNVFTQPTTYHSDESGSPFHTEPPRADQMMPLDEANAELARLRAAHMPPGHAVSHRGQRALPRGRS